MKIRIKETGEIRELKAIGINGIEWTSDLLGNHDATHYNEETEEHEMSLSKNPSTSEGWTGNGRKIEAVAQVVPYRKSNLRIIGGKYIMKKILYFEGAGWSGADISKRTIGNCRIRTAFTNNDGRKIYLEITGCEKSANDKKINRYPEYQIGDAIGFVDYCFYIDTESKDPCNNCVIREVEHNIKFAYTKTDITKMINENLNCSFDAIEVLPDLGGYSVHADNRGYNMMENYNYNPELIQKREEIERHFYELEKSEGKEYPNFSLWVDGKDIHSLHLLRHFNGYNKHWSIHTNSKNWEETIAETVLGEYGC